MGRGLVLGKGCASFCRYIWVEEGCKLRKLFIREVEGERIGEFFRSIFSGKGLFRLFY